MSRSLRIDANQIPRMLAEFKGWLLGKGYHKTTIKRNLRHVREFLEFSKGNLSDELVREFVEKLDLSNRSKRNVVVAINRFRDFLMDKGLLKREESKELSDMLEEFSKWLMVEGLKEHTIKVKTWHARKWIKWCSEHEIDLLEATEGDARNFILDLIAKGYQAKTIQHYISNLRSFYEFLRWRYGAKLNPFERIPMPKAPKRLPRALTMEEVDLLFRVAKEMGIRYYVAIRLLYATGLRVSEAIELRWRDVDLRRRQILVRHGKGGKEAVVFFDEETGRALFQWKSLTWGSKEDRVLGIKKDDTLRKLIKEIGERAGIKVTPHMLRHSLGTHLAELGFRAPEIQRILRHEKLETTGVYINLRPEFIREKYKEFWRLREKRKT